MTADLKIHIWDKKKLGEDVMKVFFHNSLGNKYGAGLFGGWTVGESIKHEKIIEEKYGKDPFRLIANTPSYYCGETSTLKANIFDDNSFLYGMDAYFDLMGDGFQDITDDFIQKAGKIDKKLAWFLICHKGKTAFKVVW